MLVKFENALQFIRARYVTEPFLILMAILYLCFFVFFILHPSLQPGEQQLTDYISFWAGGREMAANRPEVIFNEPAFKLLQETELGKPFEGILPWVISPSFMIYAVPLAKLPYLLSLIVFNLITLGTYAAMVWVLFPNRKVLLGSLVLPAVLFCLFHGQTGLMSAALIGGMIVYLPKKPFVAGLLLGLLIYKPQIGVLFPFALVAGGYWRTIAGAACTAIASVVLSFLLFGWTIWDLYLFSNFKTFEHLIETQHSFARIQTVFGLVRVLTGSSQIAMIIQGICGILAAGIVFWTWRQKIPYELKASVLVLGICFSTPYLQLYDCTIMTIVFVLLVRLGEREGYQPGDKEWLFLTALITGLGIVWSVGVVCSLLLGWRVWLHIKHYRKQHKSAVS